MALLLVAGTIAVLGSLAGQFAAFREFDVDPRLFLFMAPINLIFFCVFLLPVTAIILFFIRRKFLRPWLRTLLACIPSLVLVLPYLGRGLVNPKQAEEVFAKRMNHPLPKDASGLRSWYFRGIGEDHYMFSFRTTRAATDDLLQTAACQAEEYSAMMDPELGVHFELPINDVSVPKGWPKPKSWDDLKVYRSDRIKDYCYILTDASKTQVFVMVGDT